MVHLASVDISFDDITAVLMRKSSQQFVILVFRTHKETVMGPGWELHCWGSLSFPSLGLIIFPASNMTAEWVRVEPATRWSWPERPSHYAIWEVPTGVGRWNSPATGSDIETV